MKKMYRRPISLLLALLLLLSLCLAGGCNTGPSSGKGQSAKDSIVIATMSETPSLSPTEHNAVAGTYMNLLTYETLLVPGADLTPEPCLAESFKAINDLEWEFKLRKGVKFHNGEAMTAADVKASLDWAKTFPQVKNDTENIDSVAVIDDYTVRIKTVGPCAIIQQNLTSHGNAILPKSLIEAGNNFNENPIGTGPYVFKKWDLGTSLTFEAFADYWGGEPAIKNMTWRIIPEGSSRTIALEAGEIDFIVEVEQMDIERLENNKDLTVYRYDTTDYNYMMLNTVNTPGLDNAAVRHAMNCAINKENVVAVAANNLGIPAQAQIPMNLPGASDGGADAYDVEKARQWLAQSGVDPADVHFSIICSNDMKKRAGEVIQADLKEIGIHCELESMDLATYLSAVTDGDFTAAIGGYNASNLITFLKGVYHSESSPYRLNNKDVDAAIEDALHTIDPSDREKKLNAVCDEINSYCPVIPLWQPVGLRAFNAKLKGVQVNPLGTLFFKDVYWEA